MKQFGVLCLALASAGCGGGSPLLHPARTLPLGDVRAAGGVSANVAAGSLGDDLRIAKDLASRDATQPGSPGSSPEYAKGALVAASIAPGVAPFVGMRVGIGDQFEAGLAYTGRTARLDVRRSFDDGPWSLSIGVGGTGVLAGREQETQLPNVDLKSMRGYGADVPLLVGWESDGGLYKVWGGARGGFEHAFIEAVTSEPSSAAIEPIHLSGWRYYGGGVVGVAAGFNHVHVALELSAAYQTVVGSYNDTDVTVRGFTLSPATALWWSF